MNLKSGCPVTECEFAVEQGGLKYPVKILMLSNFEKAFWPNFEAEGQVHLWEHLDESTYPNANASFRNLKQFVIIAVLY